MEFLLKGYTPVLLKEDKPLLLVQELGRTVFVGTDKVDIVQYVALERIKVPTPDEVIECVRQLARVAYKDAIEWESYTGEREGESDVYRPPGITSALIALGSSLNEKLYEMGSDVQSFVSDNHSPYVNMGVGGANEIVKAHVYKVPLDRVAQQSDTNKNRTLLRYEKLWYDDDLSAMEFGHMGTLSIPMKNGCPLLEEQPREKLEQSKFLLVELGMNNLYDKTPNARLELDMEEDVSPLIKAFCEAKGKISTIPLRRNKGDIIRASAAYTAFEYVQEHTSDSQIPVDWRHIQEVTFVM